MTRVVVDASVVVKWILRDPAREAYTEQALGLLDGIARGRVQAVQPPHWLAEVAAVLARLQPAVAGRAARLLHAMELPVASEAEVYVEACRLATRLGHHLFDTLYHAVARCDRGRVLVTTDERYLRTARTVGSVVHLGEAQLR